MKHLGDITKINGATAPVVDVIIGGSPCQDLSMAGKRAGLAGERSGLYMEQLRIIKEMRENDERNGRTGIDVRPRYMVWENVPGAFSCNKGEDFAAVLTEAVRVIEPKAPDVPVPKNGWPHAGCLLGGNWSIAWRVLDAQFWGVPQRRRRIALVADFGGESAPEILFVRESVSGHSEPGKPQREEAAGDAGTGVACTMQIRCGCAGEGKGALIQRDKSATLSTSNIQTLFQPAIGIDQQGGKGNAGYAVDRCPTICSDSHGTPHAVAFTQNQREEVRDLGEKAGALMAQPGMKGQTYVCAAGFNYLNGAKAGSIGFAEDKACTMRAGSNGDAVVYGIGGFYSKGMLSDNPESGIYEADTARTLDCVSCGYPACNQGGGDSAGF